MSVIVATQVDSITEVFAIAIMAGVLQILLGALRLGRFIAYTPYSVISGFMSGVGIIIILSQTLPFGGSAVVEGGSLGAIRAWPDLFDALNLQAVVIGAVTLAVSIIWPTRLRKWLPATLAALIAGTLLSVAWGGDTPIIGDVPQGFPAIALPAFSLDLLGRAVQPAITLALLGSINTLLTSLMADSMTRTQHDSDRELIGQGHRQRGDRIHRRHAQRGDHRADRGEHPGRRPDPGLRRCCAPGSCWPSCWGSVGSWR